MNLQPVKSRFGIVGNSPGLERALATAVRVAPADITVLVRGESGTGKEALPKIIHHNSARKHGTYIAVNLRGDSRGHHRFGAVRPREGQLHRRPRGAQGLLRGGRRRHHLPR